MKTKQYNPTPAETIKEIAMAHFPDGKVFLFGSRACGNSKDDSDYDVLILTRKLLSYEDKMPYKTQIRKELLLKGIRTDIVIQNFEEADRNRLLPGHFIRRILNHAILI